MSRALGRYEILRPLARGGMAEVFLARRRVAGAEKRLVIKRIRPERAADPRFLDLFVREARLSMALAHQNIVPVFDFGRVGDDLFLAMEEVEGHDLGATLARLPAEARAVEPVLAAFVAAECAAALDYAHHRHGPDGDALRVVHRDVSPRNILVSWAGEVKLVDFGVAAMVGDTEATVRGTPAYMAPEQARGEVVDGRSDVYALGMVLWELLVGKRARTGTDPAALLTEARTGVIAAPAGIPAALAEVVRRATTASVAERYESAREMHDDLDAFVVTERAKRPEFGAPRRRLATWLKESWAGDDSVVPDEVESGDSGAIGGKLVTFVDDGPEEILGRTHRSIAETMGSVIDGDAVEAGAVAGAGADEKVAPTTAPLAPLVPTTAPGSSTEPGPRRRAPIALVGGLLAAAAIAAIGIAIATRSASGEGGATPTPTPAASTTTTVPTAPTRAPTMTGTGTETGTVAETGTETGTAPADHPPPTPPLPATGPGKRHGVAPSSTHVETPPAVPTARRKVLIGATPWANFTIDDDPAVHQTPETVELTPGRHLIHFDNPTLHVSRTTPVDVPADHDTRYVEPMDR